MGSSNGNGNGGGGFFGYNISATDTIEAGLSTKVVPPNFPCPKCKGESKESGTHGWRTCCGSTFHIGLTEEQHKALLDELQGFKDRVEKLNEMYKGADTELTKIYRALSERGIDLFPKPPEEPKG